LGGSLTIKIPLIRGGAPGKWWVGGGGGGGWFWVGVFGVLVLLGICWGVLLVGGGACHIAPNHIGPNRRRVTSRRVLYSKTPYQQVISGTDHSMAKPNSVCPVNSQGEPTEDRVTRTSRGNKITLDLMG